MQEQVQKRLRVDKQRTLRKVDIYQKEPRGFPCTPWIDILLGIQALVASDAEYVTYAVEFPAFASVELQFKKDGSATKMRDAIMASGAQNVTSILFDRPPLMDDHTRYFIIDWAMEFGVDVRTLQLSEHMRPHVLNWMQTGQLQYKGGSSSIINLDE